jgi:acyl-CoA synthetase (AMP-forming)/AMP-acid ligase II
MTPSSHLEVTDMAWTLASIVRTHARARGSRPMLTYGQKAIVVRRSGADPTAEALIDYARQRLARYKCPTSVDFLDALPRNPSGKLLKRQLREPYWKGHERRIN